MEPKHRSILVADPDIDFIVTLQNDPQSKTARPLLATNGKEAQLKIANMSQLIAAVFINPKITATDALSVIRCSYQYRPATPIYILHDGQSPYSEEQLSHLPIQGMIQKPVTLAKLLSQVGPAFIFDSSAALEASRKNPDKLNAEISAEDHAFVSIRAEDFLAGSKSFFDVYVRLSSGRYIKILQAGDQFTPDRLTTYLRKGVRHFYLRREAQAHYLSYCDQLSELLISKKNIPVEIQLSQTLNYGEESMNFLKTQGMSESNLSYAKKYIQNVHTLVKQLEPEQYDFLKDFMKDIVAYEHGVSTTMLASMLIRPLNIEGERPVQVIGLTALLHDIGLYQMDPLLRDENESILTPEQLQVYRTHPTVGANILKQVRGLDPVVAQAVEQHHERRNKNGFPYGLGAGSINRVAEIVGICDEFAKLILHAIANPEIYVYAHMEKEILPGFSDAVAKAFRLAFFTKQAGKN